MSVFIDTDAGVDDMLALFLLFHLTQPASVDVGVTFGNVPLERALRNVALLGETSGVRARKYFRGAAKPVEGEARFANDVHGDDGLGGVTPDRYQDAPPIATDDLAAGTRGARYERMMAIGPLGDLRLLAARRITAPLTVMGGAFERPGNMSAHAEFNFFCDPEAAADVFDRWPDDIHVVPLDLSHQVILERRWLDTISARHATRVTRFLRDIHQYYMDVYGGAEGIDGCHPHDALAVLAAFLPEAFTWRRGRVHVVTRGEERARSVLTPDPDGRHHVAFAVDQARFFATLESAFAAA